MVLQRLLSLSREWKCISTLKSLTAVPGASGHLGLSKEGYVLGRKLGIVRLSVMNCRSWSGSLEAGNAAIPFLH